MGASNAVLARHMSVGLLLALCAGVASAQSIVIPDFRRPEPAIVAAPGGECKACGRILSIRETTVDRRANVPQAFQGDGSPGSQGGPRDRNLVGAVVYLPFGPGSGEPY